MEVTNKLSDCVLEYVVAFSPPPFSIAPPFLAYRCLLTTAKHCARHGIGNKSTKGFGVRLLDVRGAPLYKLFRDDC